MPKRKKIFFVALRGFGLANSRHKIINYLLGQGIDVVLACSGDAYIKTLTANGAHFEEVRFKRGGFAPFFDLFAFFTLLFLYAKHKPDVVHHFNAKPVTLGTVAASIATGKKIQTVNTITGLGSAFSANGLEKVFASLGYKFSLMLSDMTVFQNKDDFDYSIKKNWTTNEKSKLVLSSGVDTNLFKKREKEKSDEKLNVLMVGRLIKQKGILEYVDVAQQIKKRFANVNFLLAGEQETWSPDTIDIDWLNDQKIIRYLGVVKNIPQLLEKTDVFLFPSYYREGVPRVLLEAASAEVPAVAFDLPGMREAIKHEETGYLVSSRDTGALTAHVLLLLKDKNLRLSMGKAARENARKRFDIRNISLQYLRIYKELGLIN